MIFGQKNCIIHVFCKKRTLLNYIFFLQILPVQFLDDYAAEGFLNVCIFILKVRNFAEIYTFVTCLYAILEGEFTSL
jgi:hypothetical protein